MLGKFRRTHSIAHAVIESFKSRLVNEGNITYEELKILDIHMEGDRLVVNGPQDILDKLPRF